MLTSVLVVAEYFPTIVQPWLLNAVEQICLRGQVTVVASEKGLGPLPLKVETLGLLARTVYCQMTGTGMLKKLFSPANFLKMILSAQFWRGVSVLGIPLSDIRLLLKHLALARVAGFDHYNIIHAHHEISAYEYLPLAKALNIPFVLTIHGLPPAGVAELSMEKREVLYRSVSHVQVNTQYSARQVVALGCPPEKIRILPQGTDLKAFQFYPRLPVKGKESLVILTVARIQSDKGHKYVIEAVANLVRAGHSIEYRIVGAGYEEDNLRQQIRSLGMEHVIKMVGALTGQHLLDEYRNAHIFILPSLHDSEGKREETQGVVIQEAQASGKIVIATNTGGIPECVEDGMSAFLVEDSSASAMEAAILRVLNQSEQWRLWQEKGRQWVESRYDINVIGEKQWELYQQAIVEKNASTHAAPMLRRSH